MASVSVTASRRRKNQSSQRQKCKEGEDMISKLPDFIIGRILSFLPTKEAVRTSVLSKRWISLWTFITELRFDGRNRVSSKAINKTSFVNFVYRVLLRLNSASIQSFSLDFEYDPYHINRWIAAVLNRGVKKICVSSWGEGSLSSDSLFKCQSLEELVLMMSIGCCVITVPTFVCLSSLTVLKLSGVELTSYSSNDSKKLTLNFPVLRKYETKNCTWSGVKSVTLEVPLLEVVSIEYLPESISDESNVGIKFCASHITEFSYAGYMLTETILSAEHIASANIALFNYLDKSVQAMKIPVCNLLNNNVECLKLNLMNPRGVLARGKDFFTDIAAFGMLSCLELDFVTGEILLGLLLKSPFLKTLVFMKLVDFDEELLNSAMVPDCFLTTLQVVKFEILSGEEHELRFAKFVMENAQVLERISFTFSYGCSLRGLDLESVKARLLSFKKSISVAVEFSCE